MLENKVAMNIYKMVEKQGYVVIRKEQGEILISITERGEEICTNLIPELIAYKKIYEPQDASEKGIYRTKGIPIRIIPGSDMAKLFDGIRDTITWINLQFQEELTSIPDESITIQDLKQVAPCCLRICSFRKALFCVNALCLLIYGF
jgi:hypothetical protein